MASVFLYAPEDVHNLLVMARESHSGTLELPQLAAKPEELTGSRVPDNVGCVVPNREVSAATIRGAT